MIKFSFRKGISELNCGWKWRLELFWDYDLGIVNLILMYIYFDLVIRFKGIYIVELYKFLMINV